MTCCEPPEDSLSFFKVIRDPSSPHLSLPKAFVKRLSENIPENVTLKTETGEHSWKLQVVKNGEDYCFVHGWDKVVKDAQLGIKDFVIFWLVDPNTFQVLFLNANGCDKDLTFNDSNVGDGHDDDDDDNVVVDEDDDNDDDDDDDEVMQARNDDDEVMQARNDDDDDNNNEVMQDGNLCFQKVIKKSYIYMMWLPIKFVRAAGLENVVRMKLKDHEGNEWMMDIKTKGHGRRTQLWISSGWSKFRDYHQLSEGDVCFFKFNKNEGVLNLTQVLKSKKAIKKEASTQGDDEKEGKATIEKT